MTDMELLGAAAKAAGIMVYFDDVGQCCKHHPRAPMATWPWNPLDDDGDALRLLAALPSLWTLALKFGPHVHLSVAWGTGAGIVKIQSVEAGDMAAAIRRAIVSAAAAMCRNLLIWDEYDR